MTYAQPLDLAFAALADPTRRAIVARLAKGEATVMELARPFDMSQPAISMHLKVLERAGLISRRREAQTRPCKLEPEALKAVADWVFNYREFWEQAYERLDELLIELKNENEKEKEKPNEPTKTRSRRRAR